MLEKFEDLRGQTLITVENVYDEVIFTLANGDQYRLYHQQDCCEMVIVEDVIGDLTDLVGSPITMAEEVTNADEPKDFVPEWRDDSETWTFYKLATIKGYVTIRWYGSSSGHYSESVSWVAIQGSE